MIKFTEKAVAKILEILDRLDQKPAGLRIGVRGGGCSGFQYLMQFEDKQPAPTDKVFRYSRTGGELRDDGELVVFVDQISLIYLDGVEIDYIEDLTRSGFTFKNPNVKSTCGCGSSFSA